VSGRTDRADDAIVVEVAVIGSGPGGSVTATLFAEAGLSVLMVEEGYDLSIRSAPHFSREEILQKYRNAGITVALGATKIAYVEGCCVGGGSEVNRGIYHRAPDDLLQRWREEFGVLDLTSEAMAPHFQACEATAKVQYLGADAPLFSTRLFEGARKLGWQAIEAPRLYDYGGTSGGGHKQSMSETFIPRFLRAGGNLLSDTRIDRLRRSAGKWRISATNGARNGSPRQIEISADRVVIACGAVQTPALLRRSGLKRNIGNSLCFHPMLKLVAEFADDVNRPGDNDPVHQIKEFEPDIGMGCSISSRPLLTMALASHAQEIPRIERDWRRMGLYYVQTPGGKSTVREVPFFRDPLVRIREDGGEMRRLAKGMRLLAEALLAEGAVAVYPALRGSSVLHSPADVALLPNDLTYADGNITSVHVFSSCPMGEKQAICATDSFGKVRGTEALYIADASLLCTPTGVNPQGTVMAISHRNATHALESKFR
jgi:choline dehydrogenase-like flavoprotein